MKMIIKSMFLVLSVALLLTACNNEDLFVEDLSEVVPPVNPEDTDPEDTSNPEATTPCDFNLNNLQPNQTVIINCIMDLGGATVTVPTGVTILYEGGDVVNGTLNFSSNTTISGELLNSTLTLGGAKPQLKDTTFDFKPQRWGIVEGETTSEIAQRNNNILESMMLKVKDLGVSTFKIDKMDAYFEVSKVTSTTTNQNFYRSLEAVNIPSNFNLIMTDNTILRVFPSTNGSQNSAALLAIREANNVTVKGGVLYGDRDLRKYSKPNAEEGAHLLTVHASNNVVVDGVKMTMGSVGGLFIESLGFSFNPDYNPSNTIIIKNCLFEKNRMIAFALTDGRNIIVENNTFIDTAQPTQNSDGGVVGYAIDIEPVRDRDPAGELRYYQIVQDVIIRGNKERGSRIGAFTIYVGNNIVIENNDVENVIGWSYARNSKVKNNTFTAPSNSNGAAILATGSGETVFNNEISGNTIKGYNSGITAYHGKLLIFDNNIQNCDNGIFLNTITDTQIYNNTITSTRANSKGITFQLTSANNIHIRSNNIGVITRNLNFVGLNQNAGDENSTVTVEGNTFTSNAILDFYLSRGIIFKNNQSQGRMQIENVSTMKVLSNTLNSSDGHTVSIRGLNTNGITINDNNFSRPSNNSCVYVASETNVNGLNIYNNGCN